MATITPRTRVQFVDSSPAYAGEFGTILRVVGIHPTYGDPHTIVVRLDSDRSTPTVHVDNVQPLPTVHTNNVPRDLVDAWELSEEERAQFDYLDWPAIERGEDSATFFRYRGELHDLGEFSADYGITRGAGLPDYMRGWHAFRSDSAFSGMVVRLVDDNERVIVGTVY